MDNLINPYDLGENIVEHTQKININDLVKQVQKELKIRLLRAKIEALGIEVDLTASKTRFNGDRFWFLCPICQKKIGILYKLPLQDILGCSSCLDLKYRKQRFKGMVETL